MRRLFLIVIVSVLTLILGLAQVGCSSGSDDVMSSSTGDLTVEIHDQVAPQIQECWLTIEGVQARRHQGGWTHLDGNYPHHFDLAKLDGGQTLILGTGAVPSDEYTHIRVQMSAARLLLVDGSVIDVPLPQGGMLIDIPIRQRCKIADGTGAHVSIDFRIPTSFQHHADGSWSCDPDIVVDGVWHHGQNGGHGGNCQHG